MSVALPHRFVIPSPVGEGQRHVLPWVDISDILGVVAKVLISLDDALLQRIDRKAKASGLSRSAYIAQLAKRDVIASSRGASAKVREALRRLERLGARAPRGESTAEIRRERDAR